MKTKTREKILLLDALKGLSPDSSKNNLKSWVEKGRVLVDGKVAKKPHLMLEIGQELSIGPSCSFAEEGIKIVYEDRDLVVVDKPDRLLSVASLTEEDRVVHGILKKRLGKPVYAVHRLDRDTSGLLLFAYTKKACVLLKKQFQAHTVERLYIALVEGHLEPKKGTWRSFLQEDANYFVRSGPSGELAITHYEVIEETSTFSCVKFKLETGRKNQIRVQAFDAGSPVIGDKKYGAQMTLFGRLCLHAYQLEFIHPCLGKKLKFTSPPPDLFVLKKAQKSIYKKIGL